MDKTALHQAILAQLRSELTLLTDAANTARDEATNEESRAEDKYDMRSQSAAYLAAGQAKLAGEIAEAIAAYEALPVRRFNPGEPVATGALVTLEVRKRRSWYFLGPQHGGLEVQLNGTSIMVVTAASPLGRQLVGQKLGAAVALPGRSGPVTHVVVAVE
ncbi:MAG TPA: transcription elongation factor [Opitutaceae bacterium]|nr:transcription elongation factor [Opitutaceae bacterium]